jgi:hypothetical protein
MLIHDIRFAIVLRGDGLRPAFVRALHVTEPLIFEPFCGLSLWGVPLPGMGDQPSIAASGQQNPSGAPSSLHRRYPASSVLRTSPPPHTARPVSMHRLAAVALLS